MKTIITPLDGSALAEGVLPYVRLLAPLLQAKVLLLRVVTDEEQQSYYLRHAADLEFELLPSDDWPHAHEAVETLTRRAESYLADQAQALREAGLNVTTTVMVGAPDARIAEVAQRRTDPLVVMATHGYSGVRRWALGSVADRVVHSTCAPVLLVRSGITAPDPPALKRILVPLDGSALAARALPVAAEIASCAGAEMVLLRALSPLDELADSVGPPGIPLPATPKLIAEGRERARQQLLRAAGELGRKDLTITPLVEVGHPAEVIVDEAREQRADLIVMATHGRSGLARWALGSVADKVLHAATTPVLLVRVQEAQP